GNWSRRRNPPAASIVPRRRFGPCADGADRSASRSIPERDSRNFLPRAKPSPAASTRRLRGSPTARQGKRKMLSKQRRQKSAGNAGNRNGGKRKRGASASEGPAPLRTSATPPADSRHPARHTHRLRQVPPDPVFHRAPGPPAQAGD